jgi:AraC-like DNA-binding protein
LSAATALQRLAQADADGAWELVLAAPDRRLAGIVQGPYQGWREERRCASIRREVPKSLVPVILNLGAPFEVYAPGNGAGLLPFGSFLAGAHDSFALTRQQVNACLQFNLGFLGAWRLLRLPMHGLVNRVVDLDDLLPGAAALVEELGNRNGWEERFRRLDRWLLERLAEAPPARPEVRAAMRQIVGSGGQISIGALAAAEGISRKRLLALFQEAVGLPPKRMARLVRFERAVALLRRDGGLAAAALDSGYYDQAHFNRDFRALAGETPSAYLAGLGKTGLGKNVQDGTPHAA